LPAWAGITVCVLISGPLAAGNPTTGYERSEHFRLAREAEETPFLATYRFGNPRDRAAQQARPARVARRDHDAVLMGIFQDSGRLS
jgi:hypothetical protein